MTKKITATFSDETDTWRVRVRKKTYEELVREIDKLEADYANLNREFRLVKQSHTRQIDEILDLKTSVKVLAKLLP